jgi:hypothetical protein
VAEEVPLTMDLAAFRDSVLDVIYRKVPGFDRLRCDTTYDDLVRVDSLAATIEAGRPNVSLWDAVQTEDAESLAHFHETQSNLAVLLKAQYFFAAVAIETLLAATCNQRKLSMKSFIWNNGGPPLLARLSLSETLPAYTVCIFRHKFVAHPELSRLAITRSDGTGTVTLLPSKHNGTPTISEDSAARLARLSDTYRERIPGLASNQNPHDQVSLLFYGVPLGARGAPNPDRGEVDTLAEGTLCVSLTRTKVVEAVDTFALAIVAALG